MSLRIIINVNYQQLYPLAIATQPSTGAGVLT